MGQDDDEVILIPVRLPQRFFCPLLAGDINLGDAPAGDSALAIPNRASRQRDYLAVAGLVEGFNLDDIIVDVLTLQSARQCPFFGT